MVCNAKRKGTIDTRVKPEAKQRGVTTISFFTLLSPTQSVQSPVLATTTATVELFNWPLAREQEGRDPLLCFLQTSDHKQWQLARSERNHTARVADAPGKFTCSPEKVNKR